MASGQRSTDGSRAQNPGLPGSSLLLSPLHSGFSYMNVEGNSLLVPVSEIKDVSTAPDQEPVLPPEPEPDFHHSFRDGREQVRALPDHQDNPYKPIHPHWFYCKKVEKKEVWVPFSLLDSVHLEEEYAKSSSPDLIPVVATDGGRYDVYLHDRVRCAVYWDEPPTVVRRATWFFRRDGERAFIPYPEHFAEKLEEEYCIALSDNKMHRRLEFPNGGTVVIHNPTVIVHYQTSESESEEWQGNPEAAVKPCVVRRGMDDYELVEDGETMQIDHLVFFVHGIGAICDLKFRSLPEVVNEFRMVSAAILKSHFHKHVAEGSIGRVEFLPVSWHTFLHGDATGIDDKLKPITLKSIPKLRYLANDVILDVLFYTSPIYCQAIINQVTSEMNRLYALFLQRNPAFQGRVSLAGHSLGCVILFDLLLHQADNSTTRDVAKGHFGHDGGFIPRRDGERSPSPDVADSSSEFQSSGKGITNLQECLQHLGLEEYVGAFEKEKINLETLDMCDEKDLQDVGLPLGPRKKLLAFLAKRQRDAEEKQKEGAMDLQSASGLASGRRQSEATINYVVGLAGTGHPFVIYPRIHFHPTCFFALGSPVSMFLTVRGSEMDYENFKFPTCPAFFNIYHPFDPIAYRVEPLIDPRINLNPVLIPHHKGRKRLHLEIKESLTRMGYDLKQKFMDSLRSTWSTLNYLTGGHRPSADVEAEVDKAVEEELRKKENSTADDDVQSFASFNDGREEDVTIGQLNGGRRIDYVLQEAPIESFNEYLFALGSHASYWDSEDTVLLMLTEIYSSYGIQPSSRILDPPARPPSSSGPELPHHSHQGTAESSWTRSPVTDQSSSFGHYDPPGESLYETESLSAAPQPEYPVSNSPMQPALGNVDSSRSYPEQAPTVPPSMSAPCGPPPLTGFVKHSVIRK